MRFEIGSVYTITAGLPWKFLNFDGVLRRLHSITQANSQVCFKWMSKCVIYIALRESGVIPHVKCCRRKWVTNWNFSYPENLSLIFELFQYDELRYCPESIFWKKKNFSVYGKGPNFSMRLRLRTRGMLILANFRLQIRAVWDSAIETDLKQAFYPSGRPCKQKQQRLIMFVRSGNWDCILALKGKSDRRMLSG